MDEKEKNYSEEEREARERLEKSPLAIYLRNKELITKPNNVLTAEQVCL